MLPLNPFLRAFFRSSLPLQCLPINHHILLVPTTETLLYGKDRETTSNYADLAATEEFLASHVLRVPGGLAPGVRDGGNVRESKGKAKQYATINGHTVVVKDNFVYSNKGFKTLNQAQLLGDEIHYPDANDGQQWLVYYISRPLIGSFDAITIMPAAIETASQRAARKGKKITGPPSIPDQGPASNPRKKEIKSFADLLNQFPMISRQLQGDLDRIIRDFLKQFEHPVPKKSSRAPSISSQRSSSSLEESLASLRSAVSDGTTLQGLPDILDPEEDAMRFALESATTTAIDLFQSVDRQQLSMLGATTDLSGPVVEHMIEKYIAEQLHDKVLFPRLCSVKKPEDGDLEARIRKMTDIDIAQVGIPIENGIEGKHQLALRLDKGIAVIKKMGVASSPQEMLEVLLATEKAITTDADPVDAKSSGNEAEKQSLAMTINADVLVSMLLIVIIRSGVRHLNARLSYMRNFIFIDDVESGETGYALSTFEAVLAYLANDSNALRKASRRNNDLWQAVRDGHMAELKTLLQPGVFMSGEGALKEETEPDEAILDNREDSSAGQDDLSSSSSIRSGASPLLPLGDFAAVGGSLAHVFPFQKPPTPPPEREHPRRKRVSMAVLRSTSSSSLPSSRSHSRSQSMDSIMSSTLEGETSLPTLIQTQDQSGNSLLMMAIEHDQASVLKYLLCLEDLFPVECVLADRNNEGTNLLCAALQSDRRQIAQHLLNHIQIHVSEDVLSLYLKKQDSKGRCVAHYVFHQPLLLDIIGSMLAWRLKDKNGQTPLFALCRSYDHSEYQSMVSKALVLAADAQGDGEKLHLDDHVDSKGNTLLHIVNDPNLTSKMLKTCDADVNSANDKRFTPIMVASKYGKIELVRTLFGDSRVELLAKDFRGLTAVELAKDDEVRNRIDDLVLLSTLPGEDGRITTVVRSFFVDDATIRLVLKSGGPNANGTITVTTCRRSVADFENLAKWLTMEHPASWLPNQFSLPLPFMLPSKPSRAALRDIQIRLDSFLRNLLTHATFSTHELVWEFFLVPEIDTAMLAERSRRKAEIRVEKVRDEYLPITDVHEVELFISHAKDQVRSLSISVRSLIRRTNNQRQLSSDLSDAQAFASAALSTVIFLPQRHKTAVDRYAKTLVPTESSPLAALYYALHSMHSTSTAIQAALSRPAHLIGSMDAARAAIDRTLGALTRQSKWTPNIGFFDDTRRGLAEEADAQARAARRQLETLGAELRYTQQTVAAELAGWQEQHVKAGRAMVRAFVRGTVVKERDRLDAMRRALRELRK